MAKEKKLIRRAWSKEDVGTLKTMAKDKQGVSKIAKALKRSPGATSVMAYRDEGIIPEAFRNFLALLGWTSPEGTPEVLADAELIRLFGLEGISRSNAVFDRAKLDWFNTEYIRAYPAERLLRDVPLRARCLFVDERKIEAVPPCSRRARAAAPVPGGRRLRGRVAAGAVVAVVKEHA